ncbi:MAG: hypothetical protein U0K79_06475 [Phascolarctobacterium sp.]|nr:hypothetical protein [Phascolarctobacterium sp.]
MAKFFTLYDEQPPKDSVLITQPSMTDQTFADECDIHHIIANFNMTGIVDSVGAHDPSTLQYGDTTLLPDYETACNLVSNVNAEFAALPSSVRAEFGNDPRQLLDALISKDDKVVARLEELGLKSKPQPQPVPQPVPQPNPVPQPAAVPQK